MKRTLATLAAASTLAAGLVACSNDEAQEGTDTAETAASGVTEAAGGGEQSNPDDADENVHASDASATVSEGDDPANDGTGADGESTEPAAGEETVEQETADGETTLIPAEFKSSIEEVTGDWGQPETIQQEGDTAVATFAEGNHLVWSEDTGSVPLVGEIGNTWINGGGLNNEIGVPTAPEREITAEPGWTQEFTNGVINWVNNDGEWTAQVQQN